jgi:hypothetical protein
MTTFKQQVNNNRYIMVLAPIQDSMCSLVITNISRIIRHKINIPITKQAIYACMTSAYVMTKEQESELLEVLAYMGIR